MIQKKRILLVDDHPVFRAGLKQTIEANGGFEVVAEASSAAEGLRLASRFKPDVAIVDLSLPDKSGVKLTADLLAALPDLRVMVVSVHTRIHYVASAVKAGAKGYVVKESAADCIMACLNQVALGKEYIDPSLSNQMFELMSGMGAALDESDADKYASLTRREQEVLRLVAEGYNTRQIAERLGISRKTVSTHRHNILKKLGLSGIPDLIKYAAQIGVIDLDKWKEGIVLG